ncbi:MAG: GDSL-type esterase/lipase family protein [Planctomycetota bacterium]
MTTPITRRAMLAGTAAAATALSGCKATGSAGSSAQPLVCEEPPAVFLKPGATVLLQGDSITDAGRKKDDLEPNSMPALGKGYASMIAYHLLTRHKDKGLKIYNRGISGNKVPQLDARWGQDCLDLKPDVLSVMIGVNDYWHTVAFGNKYDGTVESYGTGLKALLMRTMEALPEVQVVICEPFVVRAADGTTRPDWFPEFDERRARAQEAARSVGAVWVPFQSMFDDAVAAGTPNKHWSRDDIHVNPNGAALMAMRWLSETGLG